MFEWLQNWYQSQCNEDWEHLYGLVISTIDNPGWSVVIDLDETKIESLVIPYTLHERTENDWIAYKVSDRKFTGYGDPSKLEDIIKIFSTIWSEN